MNNAYRYGISWRGNLGFLSSLSFLLNSRWKGMYERFFMGNCLMVFIRFLCFIL